MLSVWHKADIYRIPIYAPVTAGMGEGRGGRWFIGLQRVEETALLF